MNANTAEVETFEAAYRSWRERPFPPGSSDDELDDLHADLALADSWVAASVVPYVKYGRHQPAKVDVLAELQALGRRAERLTTNRKADESKLAVDYRQYVEALVEVYTSFLGLGRTARQLNLPPNP